MAQEASLTVGPFPRTRLRRNRADGWTRRLVAETKLSVDDLIWPVFVHPGTGGTEEAASMPGAERVTLDRLAAHAGQAAELGIPMAALFPATPAELKDADGTEALKPDNLICQAARLLKREFPGVGLLGDVALDLYATHGHDGVLREVEQDLLEGADMVMVKPGMPYLDVVRRVRDRFGVPTFAYQVSGEYAMSMAAVRNGWLDHDRAMMESLLGFKRAGAARVLTYFAVKAACLLQA